MSLDPPMRNRSTGILAGVLCGETGPAIRCGRCGPSRPHYAHCKKDRQKFSCMSGGKLSRRATISSLMFTSLPSLFEAGVSFVPPSIPAFSVWPRWLFCTVAVVLCCQMQSDTAQDIAPDGDLSISHAVQP